MISPCPNSKDGRHNFVIAGGDCLNGCGFNQRTLSYGGMEKPKQDTYTNAFRAKVQSNKSKGIHSPLHQHIKEMMEEFNEPKTFLIKGQRVSTFGYYLRHLRKIPDELIWQWRAEIRQSPDIKSPGKVFWWKLKEYKNKRVNS